MGDVLDRDPRVTDSDNPRSRSALALGGGGGEEVGEGRRWGVAEQGDVAAAHPSRAAGSRSPGLRAPPSL